MNIFLNKHALLVCAIIIVPYIHADDVGVIGQDPVKNVAAAVTSGDAQKFSQNAQAAAQQLDGKDMDLVEAPVMGEAVKEMGALEKALKSIKITQIKAAPKGTTELEISGRASAFGGACKVSIVLDVQKKGAYVVLAPDAFTFASIDDSLKVLDDQFSIKDVELAMGTQSFTYKSMPVSTYKEGITLFGTVTLKGVVDKVIGKPVAMKLKGFISRKPSFVGSKFGAEMPTEFDLGPSLQTQKSTLSVTVKQLAGEQPSVAVSVGTGLKVTLPNDKPLVFKTEMEFDASVLGRMSLMGLVEGEWKGAFGFDWLSIRNVGIQAGKAYTDNNPITEFAIQGGVSVGSKQADLVVQVKAPLVGEKSVSAVGTFKGGLYLSDIAELAAKAVGKQIDMSKLPNLGIKNAKLYIVTEKSVTLFGKPYSRGIYIVGNAVLFGKVARMVFAIDPKLGIVAEGYIEKFDLGVLAVTGDGPDRTKNTEDDGAYVDLKATIEKQSCFISCDAELKAPILGGLFRQAVRMEVTRSSVSFSMMQKVFDAFLAQLDFVAQGSIEELTDNEIMLSILFQQEALARVRGMFGSSVRSIQSIADQEVKEQEQFARTQQEIAASAQRNMEKDRATLDEATQKLKQYQQELGDLDLLRVQAEEASNACSEKGQDCWRAAKLWPEWLAKKSAFYSLQGLISTQEATIKAAQASFNKAQQAYNSAQKAAEEAQQKLQQGGQKMRASINKALQSVGNNFDKVFDINSVRSTVRLSDIPKMKLTPKFTVNGILMGKPWQKDMQLSVDGVKDATMELFNKMF